MEWQRIELPLNDEVIRGLRAGCMCLLYGKLLTARDKAHQRIAGMIARGEALPFSLAGETIYYVGPTPPAPGRIIGAAGPTTSSRMDPFTGTMLGLGVKGMIGKGRRDLATKKLIQQYKAVYFSSIGGAGAYLSMRITAGTVVAFDDLAAEAVYELEVNGFPVIVACDMYGGDIYEHQV
jgi:fumarate hydratase subunit beta